MKFALPLALLALTTASPAFAAGKVLLICNSGGGSTVTIVATDSKQKVSLEMNDTAASYLGDIHEVKDLSAGMESADSGSTAGPIDDLDVGTFDNSQGECGLSLQFNKNNQRLGRNRDVALQPSHGDNQVVCKDKHMEFESCTLGPDLVSLSALRNFIGISVAD